MLAEYYLGRSKYHKAFRLVDNAMKYNYRDPTLWSMVHQIAAATSDIKRSVAASAKAVKYKNTFVQERLAYKLLASGHFAKILNDEFNLNCR